MRDYPGGIFIGDGAMYDISRSRVKMVGFNYMEASELALIKRGLELLYSTAAGTCPGDRAFGLDQTFESHPTNIAENLFATEVIEKTEYYYPEVEVDDITYQASENGELVPTMTITPADGIDDEDADEDEEADED